MTDSPAILGVAVSGGLAVGPVHIVRAGAADVPAWFVPKEEAPAEIGRLAAALTETAEMLEQQRVRVARSSGEKDAEIFAVHRMILTDPSALREVEATISQEGVNAEAAVQRLIQRFEETLGQLEGASVRGTAADVSDPWRRVLDTLLQRDRDEVRSGEERVVLAAPELTPQVVAWIDRSRILAVVCEKGGRYSHGAVLCRSMSIPCVVGLNNLLGRLEQNMTVVVDGDEGRLQLRPSGEDLEEVAEAQKHRARRAQAVRGYARREAVTRCEGLRLRTQVNVESVLDLETFDVEHCDGVGLLRTEFLYMERPQFPSEEEQVRLYRKVVERLDGRPVTIRTLDIGADKQLPYFETPAERNPALGWRGLRVSLQWPDLFAVQLRAILRASAHGPCRILLPMVSSLEQIDEVRQLLDSARSQLEAQGYPMGESVELGVMVEVPSAVLSLHHWAPHIDFVSVGTNDLVQYLLAVDRDNGWVAKLYAPSNPAVIASLARVAEVAREAGLSCAVCGDVAGDPAVAVFLAGLGYDSISCAPGFLAGVKHAMGQVTADEAREIAAQVLAAERGPDVRERIAQLRQRLYASIDG